MARRFQAVIGANFGDEGKGRTVDYLCSLADNPIVVRHNSGAQAGHTVELGQLRHVHQHFGSGTLRGAPTLLAHRFVVNPVAFNREWDALEKIGIVPCVFVEEDCIVSSPLDMILNQIMELSRGEERHGSCGMGFGETIARHEGHAALRVKHLNGATIVPRCEIILGGWFKQEWDRRGLKRLDSWPEGLKAVFDAIMNKTFNWPLWKKEVDLFLSRVTVTRRTDLVLARKNVIFEGAQGLMLHQDHEYFPHVTRSRTGLEDIVEFMLARSYQNCNLEAFYCTRTYLTRHGNGPLPGELPQKPSESIVDLTNQPNDWQGSLRFANYQHSLTMLEIVKDISRTPVEKLNKVSWSLVANCADQVAPSDSLAKADIIGWGAAGSETEDNRPRINNPRRKIMGSPAPSEEPQKFAPPAEGDGGTGCVDTAATAGADPDEEDEEEDAVTTAVEEAIN